MKGDKSCRQLCWDETDRFLSRNNRQARLATAIATSCLWLWSTKLRHWVSWPLPRRWRYDWNCLEVVTNHFSMQLMTRRNFLRKSSSSSGSIDSSRGYDVPIRSGMEVPMLQQPKPASSSSSTGSRSSSKSPSKPFSKSLRGRSFEDVYGSWLETRYFDDYLDMLEGRDLEDFDFIEARDLESYLGVLRARESSSDFDFEFDL